jgi:hypothetical protein
MDRGGLWRGRVMQEPERYLPAAYVLATAAPLFFAVASVVVVLLPPGLALPICVVLYAVVIAGEARCHICSPQSLSLGAYFAGCTVAVWLVQEQSGVGRYAGAGGFAALFLLALGRLGLGHPLHRLWTEVPEPPALRRAKAAAWLVVCAPAMALSLPRLSGSAADGVQLGLAVLAVVALGAMDLSYCGRLYRRDREFGLGGFTFREIGRDAAAVAQFLSSYADEMSAAVTRDRRARVKYGRSEIFEEVCRTEHAATARVHYFNAYDGDKVVGGVAVALDGPDRRLPVEKSFGVTLDPLRRYGRIMEVRRLSVAAGYRFHQDIIRGLFKCAIEVALENDVSFMVDLTFHFVVNLLRKVDFEALHAGGREAFEFGSPMRLLALNFATRQFVAPLVVDPRETARYAVNQCLRCRYRRRAAIRQAWRPEYRRAWSLSNADIDSLAVANEGKPSAGGDNDRREIARGAKSRAKGAPITQPTLWF